MFASVQPGLLAHVLVNWGVVEAYKETSWTTLLPIWLTVGEANHGTNKGGDRPSQPRQACRSSLGSNGLAREVEGLEYRFDDARIRGSQLGDG